MEIFYFLLILIISLAMKSKFPYTIKQIIMTFLFLDGIGFTWIISIFIIIALVMPFIIYFEKSITLFKILVPCFYICFALITFIFNYDTLAVKVVLYIGGYLMIAFLGYLLNIRPWLKNYIMFSTIVIYLLCILIIVLFQKNIFSLSMNKYPPTIYYISYGIMISIILMKILEFLENFLFKRKVSKIIKFMSKRSFDIYFWHIFGLYITIDIKNLWIRFIVVTISSILCGAIYYLVNEHIFNNYYLYKNSTKNSEKLKKNKLIY